MNTDKLIIKLVLAFSFISRIAVAETLEFVPVTSIGITNYSVYYGPTNRVVTNRVHIGTSTNWIITNIPLAQVYFLYATAWSTNGFESNPSQSILYTNRNFAPIIKLSGPPDALALQVSPDLITWKTLAVIISTNQPLIVQSKPREFFRVATTNALPPSPE